MRWRTRLVAVVLAGAAASGCDHHKDEDPCAYWTQGAPWIAFSTSEAGTWDIHVIRADGTCRRALTADAERDENPAWAPGGVVAFDSNRPPYWSIWLAGVDSGSLSRFDAGEGRMAMSPAISPDGATLAFEGRYVGSTNDSIFVAPLAGGPAVELVPAGATFSNSRPAFSPDGATLYFISNRAGSGYEIYRIPTAGGVDPEKITTGSSILGAPAVSPDGAAIAYTRQLTPNTYDVVLYDPVHATITPLGIPQLAEPAWDPAGGRLVVRADQGATAKHLQLVPLPPGSGSTWLTAGQGKDGAPAFDRPGH